MIFQTDKDGNVIALNNNFFLLSNIL